MKINLIKSWIKNYGSILPLLAVFLFLSRCVDIVGDVEQPSSIPAGDTLTTVVHVSIPASGALAGTRLVAAVLAPKEWGASANTEVTYRIVSSSRPLGSGGTMSLIPEGVIAAGSSSLNWPQKIGNILGAGTFGANRIKTLDWIAFWSDQTYDIANGDKISVDVTFKIKTGERNVNVELGYWVASSNSGYMDPAANHAFDYRFARLETTGGVEPTMDYLEPQLAIADPFTSTDNDFLTITFDGSVGGNPLVGFDQVYLCATAYTNDGETVTVCGNDETTKMLNENTDRWSLSMWPRGYFNIPDSKTIDSIKYYFSDVSGGIIVQQAKTNSPFLYKFSCD